jgi:hypothetical protein
VRRYGFLITALALILASCGGGSGKAATTSTPAPSTTATTDAPVTTTPTTSSSPTTAAGPTTPTTAACSDAGGPTAPVTTGNAQVSALLHSVQVTSAVCVDLVRFGFLINTDAPPSCNVSYQPGPFTADASGIKVSVDGNAFVVVRCSPAYGYDFNTGNPTYTGPPIITPTGARSVRELVETGDFEGVLTWVIGLDAKRPYSVAAATTPHGAKFDSALVITFS